MPAYFPDGTSALTKSPVWKPMKNFWGGAWRTGKPNLSVPHLWRLPCPLALRIKGLTPFNKSASGVDAPTQAASVQWCFSIPLVLRLNFVLPPVPTSPSMGDFQCVGNTSRLFLDNSNSCCFRAGVDLDSMRMYCRFRLGSILQNERERIVLSPVLGGKGQEALGFYLEQKYALLHLSISWYGLPRRC